MNFLLKNNNKIEPLKPYPNNLTPADSARLLLYAALGS